MNGDNAVSTMTFLELIAVADHGIEELALGGRADELMVNFGRNGKISIGSPGRENDVKLAGTRAILDA
jgi:hypothetical protein